MKKAWYVRFKYPLLAVFVVLLGLRYWLGVSTDEIVGQREYVAPEEIARRNAAYERRRQEDQARRQQPDVEAGGPQKAAAPLPPLAYLNLDNGATLRLAPEPGQSLFERVRALDQACVVKSGAADAGCATKVAVSDATWAALTSCANAARLGLPGRDFMRVARLGAERVTAAGEGADLEIKAAGAPALGRVYDVIWRAAQCAAPAASVPAVVHVRDVVILTRGKR